MNQKNQLLFSVYFFVGIWLTMNSTHFYLPCVYMCLCLFVFLFLKQTCVHKKNILEASKISLKGLLYEKVSTAVPSPVLIVKCSTYYL